MQENNEEKIEYETLSTQVSNKEYLRKKRREEYQKQKVKNKELKLDLAREKADIKEQCRKEKDTLLWQAIKKNPEQKKSKDK